MGLQRNVDVSDIDYLSESPRVLAPDGQFVQAIIPETRCI